MLNRKRSATVVEKKDGDLSAKKNKGGGGGKNQKLMKIKALTS